MFTIMRSLVLFIAATLSSSAQICTAHGAVKRCVGLYTLAAAAGAKAPSIKGLRRVCPVIGVDKGCDYDKIATAVKAAQDGDTIAISAGVYEEAVIVRASNLKIVAQPGAHIKGKAAEGKAALVIKGNDTVIEGLECSEVKVGDNGACVRLEGRNLTLRNVYFHHSELGILTGSNKGSIVIEDSRFEAMADGKSSPSHAVYVGLADSLVFRRNLVLQIDGAGHGVKSRARATVIEGNVIASLSSLQSRSIDIPWGGDTIIRGNIIEQGPNADNSDLIGIALEKDLHTDSKHFTLIENNTVICDRPKCILVNERSPGAVIVTDNRLVGPIDVAADSDAIAASRNETFADRKAAGLAAFPSLPDAPD